MSGSRQAGSGSAGTSPGSSAASSVTSASSSLSSSPSPPSVAASAATLVSGGVAPAAGSGGLGGPGRPVLVAAAVSGSASAGGAVSAGQSRLSCAARPSAGVGGSSSSLGSSSRKRPLLVPLCNGLLNSYEDKSNDFVCPICFDMIEEAYMTKCGHSFCYKCIHQSLEDNNRCPKCNYVVDNIDHLYPNFLVFVHLLFALSALNLHLKTWAPRFLVFPPYLLLAALPHRHNVLPYLWTGILEAFLSKTVSGHGVLSQPTGK